MKKRRTGLSSETLPFHRTSFPPTTRESPLWLNLYRPHRQEGTERYEEGGGRARITINIQRGLRNHKQHRDRRELRDSHSARAGRQSHKVKP